MIKKWLYSDHDIFYRELISNGCDAITKLKKLELMGEYTKDVYKRQDLECLEQTLKASVSPYHCILESERQLREAGFEELGLGDAWKIVAGGNYYVKVFDSSLVAFTVGETLAEVPTLRMAAAHTDWPCLKLKPSPEVNTGQYGKLNIEVYGGPIYSTWLDRPLSMAGKVCVAGEHPFQPVTKYVDMKRPLVIVPNLAIHMNREVNDGCLLYTS